MGTAITLGGAHDIKGYDALTDKGAPDPKGLPVDSGHDPDAGRADLEQASGWTAPYMRCTKA